MANLKIECFQRMRFDSFGTAKIDVRAPLTDGNLYSANVHAMRDRSGIITTTLRLDDVFIAVVNKDDKDGVLKSGLSEKQIGPFSVLFPIEHAAQLLAKFLAEQQITATSSFFEIEKRLGITVDETAPTHKWSIVPDIDSETKKGIAKYLLMKKEGEFIFGWDGTEYPQHANIWSAHEATENLGGGFMALYESLGLRLTGMSSKYGQPSFELVYDAAFAVVQAVRSRIAINWINVEGAERFELKH